MLPARCWAQTAGPAANIYVDYRRALWRWCARSSRRRSTRRGCGSTVPRASRLASASPAFRPAPTRRASSRTVGAMESPRVHAANDAVTACLGAHAGADGGLVIAGTGSAGVARRWRSRQRHRRARLSARRRRLGGAHRRRRGSRRHARLRRLGPATPLTRKPDAALRRRSACRVAMGVDRKAQRLRRFRACSCSTRRARAMRSAGRSSRRRPLRSGRADARRAGARRRPRGAGRRPRQRHPPASSAPISIAILRDADVRRDGRRDLARRRRVAGAPRTGATAS